MLSASSDVFRYIIQGGKSIAQSLRELAIAATLDVSMTHPVHSSHSIGWLSHDAWSEMYIGVHWLVTVELSEHQQEVLARQGPLCQLALVGSHNLVEVLLFRSIKTLLTKNRGEFPEIEKKYAHASFRTAFNKWPEILVGCQLDAEKPEVKSALALGERRNATIHKESALASIKMARSALYSAVHASRYIAIHLTGWKSFNYDEVLNRYPPPEEDWFHDTKLVEATQYT